MKDYIIVGAGLAGICFAHTALKNNKSFVVISDHSYNASRVAAGLYNPVVLKRFTPVWQAISQLSYMQEFYRDCALKTAVQADCSLPLLRKIQNVEEQNNWYVAADKPVLESFLATPLIQKDIPGIYAPYGYGLVLHTGYLDTGSFLDSYIDELKKIDAFLEASFDYQSMTKLSEGYEYQGILAKHIVFAEGFGLTHNPYFNKLPLDGTKGELLLIKAPNLKLDAIVKSSLFILPVGNDCFKVGATYNWTDKTNIPTEEGKQELLLELKTIIQCDFEVVDHFAGVRPTVNDRRPLLGEHPKHKDIYVLNGLGTRGVFLGPSMAKMLFDYIEFNIPIDPHADIKRFKKIDWFN